VKVNRGIGEDLGGGQQPVVEGIGREGDERLTRALVIGESETMGGKMDESRVIEARAHGSLGRRGAGEHWRIEIARNGIALDFGTG
jgi:hypothetical protein